MTECDTLPGKVVPAGASLHADQAGRQVSEAVSDLPPRPFLPQDNRSALVKTDSVKRILSNVDADHGDFG
jgi:hypothetical protein